VRWIWHLMMRDDYDDLGEYLVIMGCQCRRIDRDYHRYILLVRKSSLHKPARHGPSIGRRANSQSQKAQGVGHFLRSKISGNSSSLFYTTGKAPS
jgi:hypothetical protein